MRLEIQRLDTMLLLGWCSSARAAGLRGTHPGERTYGAAGWNGDFDVFGTTGDH